MTHFHSEAILMRCDYFLPKTEILGMWRHLVVMQREKGVLIASNRQRVEIMLNIPNAQEGTENKDYLV